MADVGLVEIGSTGALLAIIFGLIEVIRRKYRESTNGDRRRAPTVVNCPNRIESLGTTLEEIAKQSGTQTKLNMEQTRLNTEMIKLLTHSRDGIDRLVEQHAPEGGRERWKIPPRMEQLQEESRDLLREVVAVLKQGGGR
jgi:hypothetical protein